MPLLPCPKCARLGRWLDPGRSDALVNHYRCNVCGYVWHISKRYPDVSSRDVTIARENP
jgi:uncharacterized Zn finger protein